MPSGVFKPYAGVSTAVLVFTKTGHGGTDQVWFYDMKADGFSLDDKRTPIQENDIPDIVARFHSLKKVPTASLSEGCGAERRRESLPQSADDDSPIEEGARARTEQSFLVPKQEIADNGYDLSINKYKQVEYTPVEYPPTSEILKEVRDLEAEINKGLDELEGMV